MIACTTNRLREKEQMAGTYFVADIHLTIGNNDQKKLFSSFLNHISGGRLYIIGDLFDFWANNKKVYAAHAWVFDALRRAVSRGCTVGLLTGNRDFLLRKAMIERFGIGYLGEEAAVAIDGKSFFLAHGHTLCLSDTQFLQYRARIWPLFKMADRVLPGYIENYLAGRFMLQSKKVIQAQDPALFCFTRSAIEKKFNAGADYVICGHTHQPETFQSGPHIFHALPAWDDKAGYYLHYEHDVFILKQFTCAV
jgi:UDP-2,3-diacylglucosamine hydrolase